MNKLLAFTISSSAVAIPLYLISTLNAYKEIENNALFVFFMLIVFIGVGIMIANELTKEKQKKKKKVTKLDEL